VFEPESYFTVNDGTTSVGTDFIETTDIRTKYIDSSSGVVEVRADLRADRCFSNSTQTFNELADQELVSKQQVSRYVLNYLANIEFNDATLMNLIEEALENITIPAIGEEKIREMIDDYRANTLGSDVTEVVYTMTVNNDNSPLITSKILDSILEDYVQHIYIPDLPSLNREVSQLFDFPMGYFYLRLDDFVSNYVNTHVPELVDTANVVYLSFLEENYYTKEELLNGGFGSGSGNVQGNVVNTDHLLSKLEASDTYVKKSDFLTADGNVHFDYTIESNINIYKYEVNDIKTFVDCVQTDHEYSYTVQSDINKIRVTGLVVNEATGAASIDNNVLRALDRVLILYPMRNTDTDQLDTVYNGIFIVDELLDSNTVMMTRAIDFKSVASVVNALIYVKSRSSTATANGNSYIVTFPTSNDLTFVMNQDSITIIPFIVQDNTHGSMAYQDHTNVNITGGSIAVSQIRTSAIQAIGEDFTVHIPADKQFQITSVIPGYTQQDPIFSVDEQGHVSAFQFAQMSDKNLKTNVKPIQSALETVQALEGKTFEWKDNNKNKRGKSYGFIAQEVEKVLPSTVSKTFGGSLTVDYNKVIPILTEAVKELYELVKQTESFPKATEARTRTTEARATEARATEARATESFSRATESFSRATEEECNRVINVFPNPTDTIVTTNVYSIGKTTNYMVNLASTDLDDVTMEPLFVSVEDRQIYSIFTNSGNNTLDGVTIEIDDIVLIKNSKDPKLNGVFKISGIQHVSFGRFSKCYRVDDFQTFGEMQHTTVIVSPSGFGGNGKGEQNIGISFTCILDALNEDSFQLDTTQISFVSFGLNPRLGTMSTQDHDNVNITGGQITTNMFTTSNLFPYDNNTTISMNLNGSTINDTFQVKNDSQDTIFSVDGTGKASAFEYYAPSDAKLKKNVHKITDALDLLQKLQGVTFDWKKSNQPQGTNYGFIAQEVAEHFPSLVHQRSDGYLAVDYSKVVSILVESVKDIGNILKQTTKSE
jgi:hypothetical protein